MSSRTIRFHPTNRSSECRYCHDNGHAIRRCPKLAKKEQRRREKASAARKAKFQPDADGFTMAKSTFRRRVQKGPSAVSGLTHLNNFAAFSEPKTKEGKKKVTFAQPEKAPAPVLTGSWAKPLKISNEENKVVPETTPTMKFVFPSRKKSIGRWADMADEESDSENEADIFMWELPNQKNINL